MSNPPSFDGRTSQTLTLEDGRTLGYAEFGPSDGHPIFHFHGLPGSRLEGKLFESFAVEHNARIITVDRPRIGLSSPQPGRTALDHVRDVQALAAHLQINRFSVMGVSGGGPYAIACAYVMPPSQLKKAAVVAGCGLWNPETAQGMNVANRWMFWGLNAAPWAANLFVRFFFGSTLRTSDEALRHKMKENVGGSSWIAPPMSEKDKEALGDGEINSVLIAEMREHFKQGYDAYNEDGKIVVSDLGFDLSEVKCGVSLWYGKQDNSVPPGIGEDYARRMKGKATLRVVDETHLSIIKNVGGEILKDLLNSE